MGSRGHRAALQPVHASQRITNAALAALLALTATVGSSAPVHAVNDKAPALVGDPWIGELGPVDEAFGHIVLMWDEIIDPTSIPSGSDFAVTINGTPTDVLGVSLIFAGFADETFGLSADGTSFMRLDLDGSWTGLDTVLVSYTPGTTPVRDLGLGVADGFTAMAATTFDTGAFGLISAAIDSYYGADHLLMGVTHPLEPASIPAADEFAVTVGGSAVDVLSVTYLHPDLGIALLDLELEERVTDPMATVLVSYDAAPTPLISARTGEQVTTVVDFTVELILAADLVSESLAPGGSLTTATLDGPTVGDPIGTTVTSPNGGTVTIDETNTLDPAPSAYTFFGQQVLIDAPDAPSAADPLALRFDLDASLVPAGEDHLSIVVLRNGVAVPECTGDPGEADPTPCVAERIALTDGDISITVLTVQASTWNFAVLAPFTFSGFAPPVDGATPNLAKAGSAVPVKFSLGGDRGLDVFADGSPSSRTVSCTLLEDGDPIEQTVTAGSSSLSYDALADQYTYVWKTDRSWSGTCRKLTLAFADGSSASALFDFRR